MRNDATHLSVNVSQTLMVESREHVTSSLPAKLSPVTAPEW